MSINNRQSEQYQNLQISTIQFKNCIYFGQNIDKNPHGLGLILFDSGSFALAQWKHGFINGKYLFYQNLLLTRTSQYTACYYGRMVNKKFQGYNYIQSINQNTIQGKFLNGKLQGQFILEKSTSQINFLYQQNKLVQQSKIRKYRDHKNNKVSLEQPNKKNSKSAIQFLKSIVLDVQFRNNTLQNFLVSKNISQNQIFFGQFNQEGNEGIGFIFRNGWPYISGKFKNYKLNGIGTVYETQNHILQGQFCDGSLKQGVLFDLQTKKSHIGNRTSTKGTLKADSKNQSVKLKSLDQNEKFQINQTKNRIDNTEILYLRRQKHLKSLFFCNNFKTQDDFPSKWPPNLLQKIFHQEVINDLLNHLAPSYISQIERYPQVSENRVERDLLMIFNHSQEKQSKKRQIDYQKVSQQLNSYMQMSRVRKTNQKNDQILIEQNYQSKRQGNQEENGSNNKTVNRKLQYMTPIKASQLIQNSIKKNKQRIVQQRSNKKGLDLHKIYSLYLKN